MNRWWKYGKYHWNFIKVSSSISDIACEQALHLGDIVKSRRARSTREEMLKPEAGERKESVQRSLINFHFHPGNPGTLQSVKTVTAVGRRLEKKQPPVKIRQPRARRICFFMNRFCNSFPLIKVMFLTTDIFLSKGQRTSMCSLG